VEQEEHPPLNAAEIAGEPEVGGLSPAVKIGVVLVMLAAAVGFLFFGSQATDAFVYCKLVSEVMAQPGEYAGRQLRVEGELEQGSVRFREKPCEWRFVLGSSGQQMPVRFPQCVVPDTFRDGQGLSVTVQGTLQDEGWFLANQVIPRCPSKYEMEQQQQVGVGKPHGSR
jgi:cytochrome c-type biogenesis protein CcmE